MIVTERPHRVYNDDIHFSCGTLASVFNLLNIAECGSSAVYVVVWGILYIYIYSYIFIIYHSRVGTCGRCLILHVAVDVAAAALPSTHVPYTHIPIHHSGVSYLSSKNSTCFHKAKSICTICRYNIENLSIYHLTLIMPANDVYTYTHMHYTHKLLFSVYIYILFLYTECIH